MAVIKFFGNLREIAGIRSIELPGSNVAELLQSLCLENESMREALFDGAELKPFVRVMLDGKDIELVEGLDSRVSDNSSIAIFPPIAGGCLNARNLLL